jgi:3-phosphoshikimate 1-carboxyvinyltransferase
VSAQPARKVAPARGPLRGSARVPGDKSIAHRAVLLNAVARGTARVRGLPDGADVRSSISAVRMLGCSVDDDGDALRIFGRAGHFEAPRANIDCGNSGTTMRLLAGLLAGGGIEAVLDGDVSLRRRPMARVAKPLREMGAHVETTGEGRAPIRIHPAELRGTRIDLEIASAQVKSAVLLAGLAAAGETAVREPLPSRDHTERMLASMGIAVRRVGTTVSLDGPTLARCVDVDVCGDASSAAFFAVAAALVAGSDVSIREVCLNPTRIGFVAVLKRMGADVEVQIEGQRAGEPIGTLRARGSRLRATDITPEEIPGTIDELPVLAVAAALAEGTTIVRGAAELRFKESDRIATVTAMIAALGGRARATDDGMEIEGNAHLRGGARVATAGDHRLVMAAAVAALACREPVEIDQPESAAVSFPAFFPTLETLLP